VTIDQQRVEEDARYDGKYVLRTTTDLPADEVALAYKNLLWIERLFRDLKSLAVPAHAREQLEHLCRYLLRPPLATERLTESSGGQLLYELPHPRGVATQCPSSLYR
jgi:hypothetical protein